MAKIFQFDSGGTLTTNLVSYYRLEDVNDFYASNNLTNNNTVSFSAAKINNGADFGTANTDKSLESTAAAIEGNFDGAAWSAAFWVKARTEIAASTYAFISSESTENDNGVGVIYEYNGGTRRLKFQRTRYAVADDAINYNVTLGTANWYHIAITYDGTTVRAYVDNTEVGTVGSTGNGTLATRDICTIGINAAKSADSASSVFIDELGIWSKKLSTTEISDLYNSGNGQTMINPSGAIIMASLATN